MERFYFDIGLVLFIFVVKTLLSTQRKNMPEWERPYHNYEKHFTLSATIVYLIGIIFNSSVLCLITFIPLIGLIILEVMLLRTRFTNRT
ncbi:hypothetical protein [Maribacter polysaccharolyticus]|uniref:hypothetical protein n=1 Tax=Maribacter polysaccharolyticus TaxID=3020831 RepID=UPI00237F9B46|nr:hypothetical protein [Maribacter polysaccharolyticus]MDE3744052.1 hypothetical protein [Maribacter polysaccharolyticus]